MHLLGYLAYGFPALLGYKVASSFRESQLESDFSWPMFALKVLGFILLMISACGLATLHFEIAENLPYMAGGVVGSLVVDLSLPVLATLGSTLLFFAIFLFGLTITAALSWLAVIDKIGEWTLSFSSLMALKLAKLIEHRKQEFAARERLESRKKLLDIHIQKQKKRIPPTIKATPVRKMVKSLRVEKERQGTLFAASSVKELPAGRRSPGSRVRR